jgi:hypothetical protein
MHRARFRKTLTRRQGSLCRSWSTRRAGPAPARHDKEVDLCLPLTGHVLDVHLVLPPNDQEVEVSLCRHNVNLPVLIVKLDEDPISGSDGFWATRLLAPAPIS